MSISVCWFRRDLRLDDNIAFYKSLNSSYPILPIFIFDKEIIEELAKNDARINFIYDCLTHLNYQLKIYGSSLKVFYSSVDEAWNKLVNEFSIKEVFINEDYEPYGISRDKRIGQFLKSTNIRLHSFTDHVVFKPNQILKEDGLPYTVYTPYKNKWLKHLELNKPNLLPEPNYKNLYQCKYGFPKLSDLDFLPSSIKVEDFNLSELDNYEQTKDIPYMDGTSYLGPHLRFGTVSIRSIIHQLKITDNVFLSELIWREFFVQILYHFPRVVNENFKLKYNGIKWRNNEDDFSRWSSGNTGYPIVDAGMRQLNKTGYMHNRVRMITASFLIKHLLIDWRWGEAYFAEKLLDYELASNNGNWQWVAGTGCDSAPYFRVFNPDAQTIKFDSDLKYINKWVPELNELTYTPMVEHKMARERALETYKVGIKNTF
jgi:deoxyribodipyrimidine photo-lyase